MCFSRLGFGLSAWSTLKVGVNQPLDFTQKISSATVMRTTGRSILIKVCDYKTKGVVAWFLRKSRVKTFMSIHTKEGSTQGVHNGSFGGI